MIDLRRQGMIFGKTAQEDQRRRILGPLVDHVEFDPVGDDAFLRKFDQLSLSIFSMYPRATVVLIWSNKPIFYAVRRPRQR